MDHPVEMVEVGDHSQGMRAKKVVEAQILVPRRVGHLLVGNHKLDHWKSVEDRNRGQVPMVQV